MSDSNKLVLAIVGPTCTGKTALSLTLGRQLDGEIIACDSRTIYREMDIGTAKPSREEQETIAHHMLDVADPNEVFTVAQYKEQATSAIDDIHSRNKLPIVVGGTGFYARALLEGLSMPNVAPNEEFRQQLKETAARDGTPSLHQKLQSIDPESASKIGVNDQFRIIRALEVFETLGVPFSEAATRVDPPWKTVWIGLTFHDRTLLKKLIGERVQAQLDAGLLHEIKALLSKYGETQAIQNGVAYKEYLPYLKGESTLEQCIETCIQNNYQLARRQLIWFRANNSIHWFNVDQLNKEHLPQLVIDVLNVS